MKLNVLKIIFLLIFVSCSSSNNSTLSKSVQLIKADFYQFSPGIGPGLGYSYTFYVNINSGVDAKFDSVWVQNSRLSLEQVFIKDSLAFKASILIRPEDPIEGEPIKNSDILPPITHTGKALLRYYINDKPFYLIVNQLNEKPSKNYY